jgi:hypothetical protein
MRQYWENEGILGMENRLIAFAYYIGFCPKDVDYKKLLMIQTPLRLQFSDLYPIASNKRAWLVVMFQGFKKDTLVSCLG